MKETTTTQEAESSELIYEFQLDPHEKVCLARRQYRGKVYFDLRVWFEDKKNPAGFFPSKRGICLGISFLPQVKTAFQQFVEKP